MITVANEICKADLDDFCLLEQCITGGWTRKTLQAAMDGGTSKFLKAILNGKTVGYINYSIILDEAEINSIAVLNDFRQKGIAEMLIEKLAESCKNSKIVSIFLEVNENNMPAIRLYEKCGFEFVSERKNYYGEDAAFIYKKALQ